LNLNITARSNSSFRTSYCHGGPERDSLELRLIEASSLIKASMPSLFRSNHQLSMVVRRHRCDAVLAARATEPDGALNAIVVTIMRDNPRLRIDKFGANCTIALTK
jgi:hypothetical protein